MKMEILLRNTVAALWLAVSGVHANADIARKATECLAMNPAGATRERCTQLHLAAAQAAFQENHAALHGLIPRQGHALLADSDRAWAAHRDALCGPHASAECLTQRLQERTAVLISLRRFWQAQRKPQGAPALMARVSPALDPEHDEQVWDFWHWVNTFSDQAAPAQDGDGSRCGEHQPLRWWFLAGNAKGGSVQRTCTLPGRRLVVPVLAVAEPADPAGCAETRLYFYAKLVDIPRMDVSLDGTPLPRDQWPRMHVICMPHPDGKRALLAAGWWLYLPPLAQGAHRLAFHAQARRLQVEQDVVYNLVVQ